MTWKCLKQADVSATEKKDRMRIANKLYARTNFSDCIGADEEKHIRIRKLNERKFWFFNYKSFLSKVVVAVADARYCILRTEVGFYGLCSDSLVFKIATFLNLLQSNKLNSETVLPLTVWDRLRLTLPYTVMIFNLFSFAYPQIYFLFNFVPPKFLLHNSSYT